MDIKIFSDEASLLDFCGGDASIMDTHDAALLAGLRAAYPDADIEIIRTTAGSDSLTVNGASRGDLYDEVYHCYEVICDQMTHSMTWMARD